MLNWLSAHYGDLIVLTVLGLAVGAVVGNLVKRKKRGQSCGSCAGCAVAGSCHTSRE